MKPATLNYATFAEKHHNEDRPSTTEGEDGKKVVTVANSPQFRSLFRLRKLLTHVPYSRIQSHLQSAKNARFYAARLQSRLAASEKSTG
jgi:hypothetical protein